MSNPSPTGYTAVAPWIVTNDTGRLLDFITTAFGGEELARVPLEDGSIGHAEIRVGDTILLAFDQRSGWPEMPSLLRVFVDDADATMSRAVAAGARVVTAPATHAFGQRGGRVRDPFGNICGSARWSRMSPPRREYAGCPSPPMPTRCATPRKPSIASSVAVTMSSRARR